MAPYLSPEERKDIHYAGAVITYMQAIRFLADYLNSNIYYKVSYPEQNRTELPISLGCCSVAGYTSELKM
jgi:hypothetical protein